MTVPVYIAEVSPPHQRGQLVTINSLFITGGQLIASLVDGAFSYLSRNGWRYGSASEDVLLLSVTFHIFIRPPGVVDSLCIHHLSLLVTTSLSCSATSLFRTCLRFPEAIAVNVEALHTSACCNPVQKLNFLAERKKKPLDCQLIFCLGKTFQHNCNHLTSNA